MPLAAPGKVQAVPDPSHPATDVAGRSTQVVELRASRPHRPPAVRLSHRAQGPLDGARRPAASAARYRRSCGRAVCRPHRSRDSQQHGRPSQQVGVREAGTVAALRGQTARSGRARSPGGAQRYRAGALPALRRIERRPAVGRAGRSSCTGTGVRVGRTARRASIASAPSADLSDPGRLADEIERMVLHGPQTFIDLSSATTFASSRTPRHFASTVLSSGIDAAA